ncbi:MULTISPECIES: hypothetical protein [unclassified Wolbachia]|uniref:hypothetical protein n=1 Tax=unclassified Wolbachia TaxID=2640676 RepID=UPI0002D24AB7|nr:MULTISPECIES: hypothetical protein [unclassified Wolbachia]AGJ99979.1 hypothetical protein wHa_05290 [Wolbachia endosymbiont of Drosophila simulans wHa]
MEKYTNAWFNKKDNHDCANDGTCGQSIKDFRIGNSDISFFDSNKNLIAKVPKLPKYSSDKYGHQLYKEAESKQFNYFSTNIHDVLSNSFTVKYGYINCTIKYDNLSEQEQNQIETDIKTAYEAFKEKFCFKDSSISKNITVYIFNNRSDYTKYNNLLGIDEDGSPGYITRGVTDCQNTLTYKQSAMDFVLGHELGHIFQLCFSPSATVQTLSILDTELIANVVGREVEEKNYKAICKQMGVDEYKYDGWSFIFKYIGTTGSVYRLNLSEEEKFQIIQRVKSSGLDEYEDHGWMFKFKYKDTTGSIYLKDLSEDEKFQIIQRVKNSGLDEYEDHGWIFSFKYKGTTYNVRYKDFSEDEKFKAIQNVKNIHELVDEYKDHGWIFSFKYKGTTYNVRCKYFSEEEKFQFIKDIKNSHESLVSECDGLGNENTVLSIHVDENKEISRMYFRNSDKNIFKQLDKTLISRSKSEEEVNENRTNPEPEEEQKGDDYTEVTGMLQFKYKGTNYAIQHRGYLLVEEEKLRLIQDIKNSHESLVSERYRLNEGSLSQNATVVIFVDENKDIEKMYFHNPDKNMSKWLDKTLISRSKPEQDVDDTAGKEPEPESAEEDTQQPSNFLSNIFSAIKSIIDSISSLFSWLFGSKEKESNQQSDDNPSLFKLDANELDHEVKPDANELGHDVRDHLSDNYNHYNSSDGLM